MVHIGTRSKAAQDRKAERGILHCKEEPYQVSSVKLLERLEINALAMATQEQIAEAMNAMQRQIVELAGQLAEERHRGASLDRVAQVLDRWTTQEAQEPVARLVDTRGIGRPSNFGSGEEKSLEKSFPVWQRKMQKYIVSVFPDLREPLEWAAMTAVLITHQLVDQRFGSEADPTDQVTDLEDKMHQVFAVLMQVSEGEGQTTSSAIRAEWGWKLGGS